jgi:glycerophosphoryl diester phosphodiesterase
MNRPWPYPRIVAHRGGGRHAPENTLAAIRAGQALGFRAHEFDVKLTRDGVAVLMHDATLERTTNGKGRAADLSWAELQELDAGGWHSEAFRGEKIPDFATVARALRERGTMAHIEIKPTPGFDIATGEQVARQAAELFEGAPVLPVFSSFSYEALMSARLAWPEAPRGWLIDHFTDADWDRMRALEAASLHTNHKKFDLALVKPLHDAGYRIMLYTVNDLDRARALLDAGVDGVFTDELEAFAAAYPQLI